MDGSRTKLQINHGRQLFIDGKQIKLSAEEKIYLNEYARGLHYVVPKMVILANEGVDIAVDTIEQVYFGLVGSDHDSVKKITSAMKRAKKKIKEKYGFASGHYFIGPGSFESVDEFVDSQIEAELEKAIKTSVGGILSAISGVNQNVDGNDARIQTLTEKLEAISEQMDFDDPSRAKNLRAKAQWFCGKLKTLNNKEEKLRESIPAFRKFDIIVTSDQA